MFCFSFTILSLLSQFPSPGSLAPQPSEPVSIPGSLAQYYVCVIMRHLEFSLNSIQT